MKDEFLVRPVAWDSPEGEHVRDIRRKVFIEEQCIPADEEYDEADLTADHVLAYDVDGNPVATGRLLVVENDRPETIRIGRMAALADVRGRGAGSAIMDYFIAEARARKYERIVLSAQSCAIPFYARFGFRAFGQEFMEAGIPHQLMELLL
jgi:predicted GNAT family N-acyltransferase